MESFDFLSQTMSEYFNLQPSQVKGRANTETEYNKRYLYTLIYSCFEFGIPREWALNFFRFWLFRYGSIGTLYTREFGWIAYPYSVTKLDIYNMPKEIQMTVKGVNKKKTGVIGVNAEIIKIMDDFFGLDDLVTHYAVKLAQIDKSFNVTLMNCNVTAFFEADGKKQAEEIKEAYSQATEGKPFVVVNKDIMGGKEITTLFNSSASSFIGDKLAELRRQVTNEFLTKIGIKNANYDKKERLNSMEVEQNNDEVSAIINVIYENLKESFKRLNDISGLNLTVKMRYNYDKEGVTNESDT